MSSFPVPEQPACRHTVVYLVHGTWPRGLFAHFLPWLPRLRRTPFWYDEGSNFRNALAVLNIEFREFKWSGNNSIMARRRAASELRQILHRARKEEPDTCHLVIAHSHGGNVAVRALGRSRPGHPLADGIATMGTPFFHIYKRNTQPWSMYWGQAIFFDFVVWVLGNLAMRWATGLTAGSFVSEGKLPISAQMVMMAIVVFITSLNVVWYRMRNWIVKRTPISPRPFPWMLILRAPRDEASIALATVQFAHTLLEIPWWLTRLFQRVLARLVSWSKKIDSSTESTSRSALEQLSWIGLWVVFVWLAVYLISDVSFTESFLRLWGLPVREGPSSFAVWVKRTLLIAILPLGTLNFLIMFLIGALSVAGGLLLVPFGWEFLFCGLSLEINAEATPPGGSYPVETVYPSQTEIDALNLRHKLYELPLVNEKLVGWIEEQRRS